MREIFWPLGDRNLARKTVYTCINRFLSKPEVQIPTIGALPKERMNPSPPFFTSDVDYA